MCLIVSVPSSSAPSCRALREGWDSNPDGAGFSVIREGRAPVTRKGFTDFYVFYQALMDVTGYWSGKCSAVVHFRKASPGLTVTKAMCHPFRFRSQCGQYAFTVFHNGWLDWRTTPSKSDTACFISDLLKPILGFNPVLMDFPAGHTLVERAIGRGNKMVILRYDRKAKVTVTYTLNAWTACNGRVGHEVDGVWYSNHSYLPTPWWARILSYDRRYRVRAKIGARLARERAARAKLIAEVEAAIVAQGVT